MRANLPGEGDDSSFVDPAMGKGEQLGNTAEGAFGKESPMSEVVSVPPGGEIGCFGIQVG